MVHLGVAQLYPLVVPRNHSVTPVNNTTDLGASATAPCCKHRFIPNSSLPNPLQSCTWSHDFHSFPLFLSSIQSRFMFPKVSPVQLPYPYSPCRVGGYFTSKKSSLTSVARLRDATRWSLWQVWETSSRGWWWWISYPLVMKHGTGNPLWLEVSVGKSLINGPCSIAMFDYWRVIMLITCSNSRTSMKSVMTLKLQKGTWTGRVHSLISWNRDCISQTDNLHGWNHVPDLEP